MGARKILWFGVIDLSEPALFSLLRGRRLSPVAVPSIHRDEQLSQADLIREKYRGIRPAAGYPACPDHAEKRTLFELLEAEQNAAVRLTESFAMHPGASVSGLYFSHPEAKYFGVGQIGHDQVVDYATRRGESPATVEKRLAPNLDYNV